MKDLISRIGGSSERLLDLEDLLKLVKSLFDRGVCLVGSEVDDASPTALVSVTREVDGDASPSKKLPGVEYKPRTNRFYSEIEAL